MPVRTQVAKDERWKEMEAVKKLAEQLAEIQREIECARLSEMSYEHRGTHAYIHAAAALAACKTAFELSEPTIAQSLHEIETTLDAALSLPSASGQ